MEHQRYLSRYCERLKRLDTILATDEVAKMRSGRARKAYLEKFIVKNSQLIGEDLKLIARRTYMPEGMFDLWFENSNDMIIVELKSKRVGEGDLDNLRRCIHNFHQHRTSKKVCGILVCEGVSSALFDEIRKERDIQVFCFGWKMLVFPKKWN